MRLFIDYWEKKCGAGEPIHRFRTLLSIREGSFEKADINDGIIDRLVTYKHHLQRNGYPDSYYYYFQPIDPSILEAQRNLITVSKSIANQIEDAMTIEELQLMDFYRADSPTFELIRRTQEDQSKLSFYYQLEMEEIRKMPSLKFAIYSGVAVNQGALSIFGNRPQFGVKYGGKSQRHNYDLVADIKAGPSPTPYTIRYMDSTLNITTFTGFYAGLEYGYSIVNRPKWDVSIYSGLGYEGITAMKYDNEIGEESYGLPSLNLNLGMMYRQYFKDGMYLGLDTRINWVNFQNEGGTPLKGKYISLRLVAGGMANFFRDRRLENLK